MGSLCGSEINNTVFYPSGKMSGQLMDDIIHGVFVIYRIVSLMFPILILCSIVSTF